MATPIADPVVGMSPEELSKAILDCLRATMLSAQKQKGHRPGFIRSTEKALIHLSKRCQNLFDALSGFFRTNVLIDDNQAFFVFPDHFEHFRGENVLLQLLNASSLDSSIGIQEQIPRARNLRKIPRSVLAKIILMTDKLTRIDPEKARE